ncbi:methyl-accepting chemotaxis protein [Chamaesiphon minutus]|uniref:Methyl-accepting chemotaxis protein n=1 Tax=Chamaesiphon minutus (strain ATCC 27169 / PCC 6605) TaxID=1173020 RepID=K9UN14_CHAP6|nr:methyl-accepting chemotaxis protein [Chamaesiphon minutus]AFY95801.1 methyl-accepting chemotaxis protein [Chamaesiphon minutus PCC 6605]
MNSNQNQTRVEAERAASTKLAPLQQVRKFVRKNLVATITATIGGSLLLTGASTWNIWNIYNGFQSTVTKQVELQKNSGQSLYIGQILSYSVKLSATTGDPKWEALYRKSEPELDRIIKQVMADVPPAISAEASKTDEVNQKLIAIETEVFKLVRQGKKAEAMQLLFGAEYSRLDQIYYSGTAKVLEKIDLSIKQQLQDYQRQLLLAMTISGVTLPILIGIWILVLSAVRDYIRDRQIAQAELQQSQASLSSLNAALQTESAVREQQEAMVRLASEQLQQDIGDLLDVVCEIESGDFTVQAQVNDRATGLVGDTLNRLIEELGRTLRQVAETAYRVDANSKTQKEMAATVAQSTSKQAEEIQQMLQLTRNVRQSAQNNMEQLNVTNRSLVTLKSSVAEGQGTISSLDRDINILQAGSDRIVQEVKTLGEFVGLADRFVLDQSEIVTQTQILALNASLVAARAAEQRDPKLFAAVAREFESIATQVSQLAQQTNEGLTNLEQRSTQIHKVVSSVDADVQRLGGLVTTFTQGVKQASDVFETVQSVTERAVESGDRVSTASQRIVGAADSTSIAIESISSLSQQITDRSQDAQKLGDRLNILSTELLENIQVFKLPEVLPVGTNSSDFPESAALEVAV